MSVLSDTEGEQRHLATVLVTPKLLLGILQGDGARAARFSGIPKDAKLVGAQLNDDIPAFVLVLEHPDFPKVLDGIMPMPLNVGQVSVDLCDRCLIQYADAETARGPRGINYTIFRDVRMVEKNREPIGHSTHCPRCGAEIPETPCYKCGYEEDAR